MRSLMGGVTVAACVLVIAGAGLLLLRLVLQWAGICPIVKRVWTSSYTLYSGGLVVLMLAVFYALLDWKGWRRWAFPLLVVGMNSIAVYVMSWTMVNFFSNALDRHAGGLLSRMASPTSAIQSSEPLRNTTSSPIVLLKVSPCCSPRGRGWTMRITSRRPSATSEARVI